MRCISVNSAAVVKNNIGIDFLDTKLACWSILLLRVTCENVIIMRIMNIVIGFMVSN